MASRKDEFDPEYSDWRRGVSQNLYRDYSELVELDYEILGVPNDGKSYHDWYKLYGCLSPHYIPTHQAMIDAVRTIQADT